jgi:putative thioredoxin
MNDIILDNSGPSAGNGADKAVIDTTTQGFVADVLEESRRRPVLVDFWAPWCGPCRTLSPIIERAVGSTNGAVRLVKMNIDDHPAIPGQLGIQSIPAVIAFVDGKPVDGFVGALPEGRVKAFIDKVTGDRATSGVDNVLAEADTALTGGNANRAAELYAAVRQADTANLRAIAGLARAAVAVGDIVRAKQMLAMAPPAKAADRIIAAAAAEIELAEQTGSLGDPKELIARVEADPADHQARFDLALLSNVRGDRAGAVDHLLAIISTDREWNDHKARKQLLQFFDVWGPKDEATISGRRRLSSLLFS